MEPALMCCRSTAVSAFGRRSGAGSISARMAQPLSFTPRDARVLWIVGGGSHRGLDLGVPPLESPTQPGCIGDRLWCVRGRHGSYEVYWRLARGANLGQVAFDCERTAHRRRRRFVTVM